MGVVMKPVEEFLDALVNERMVRDVIGPILELRARGQFAVQDQISGFEVGAALGQFLDGIAAVAQDAGVAVNKGDFASAQRRVVERRVVAHHAELVRFHLDLAKIERADRVVGDRHFVGFARAVIGDGERVPAHACASQVVIWAGGLTESLLSASVRNPNEPANLHQ